MIEQRDVVAAPSVGAAHAWLVALRQRAAVLAPQAVVALVLLLSARVLYVGESLHGALIGFAELAATFARYLGLQSLALSRIGYDGQFAYYTARQPSIVFTCASNRATCPLDIPILRAERILYPRLARLLALGQPSWIPFTLLLLNFVAVLVAATVVSAICVELGRRAGGAPRRASLLARC